MLHLSGNCPHCGSGNGFEIFGISPYIFMENHGRHEEREPVRYSVAGRCLKCEKPVAATCESLVEQYKIAAQDQAGPDMRTMQESLVVEFFPKPAEEYAHSAIPDDIRKNFAYAQKMIQDRDCPSHMVISACHGVLEKALRQLGADEGKGVREQIGDLLENGHITAPLNDWARMIVKEKEDSLAQIKVSYEDAEEMLAFTRMFLQSTFEVPILIEGNRRRRALREKG